MIITGQKETKEFHLSFTTGQKETKEFHLSFTTGQKETIEFAQLESFCRQCRVCKLLD